MSEFDSRTMLIAAVWQLAEVSERLKCLQEEIDATTAKLAELDRKKEEIKKEVAKSSEFLRQAKERDADGS